MTAAARTGPGPAFDLSGAHLTGRTALVTGAANGIGRACAVRLASAGAHVIALDIDRDGVEEVAGEVDGDALVADLADPAFLAELPEAIDVVVNNAGLQRVSTLEDFPRETFAMVLKVMLEAPFLLISHSLPHMYAQGWGRIVNISSVHGLVASPYKAAYVCAKHGLEGLSKVAALEGAAHGVTSNCINPGYVRTALVDGQVQDQARVRGMAPEEVLQSVVLERPALKRLLETDEVAEMAAYLCSPAAVGITGASMVLDGGWTAH